MRIVSIFSSHSSQWGKKKIALPKMSNDSFKRGQTWLTDRYLSYREEPRAEWQLCILNQVHCGDGEPDQLMYKVSSCFRVKLPAPTWTSIKSFRQTRPSFSHSLLLSLCPGGSLTGRGTGKDLKICCCSHSPSNAKMPPRSFPTVLHALRPLWSVVMRKPRNLTDNCFNHREREREREKRGKPPLFPFLPPTPPPSLPQPGRSAFAGSIWVHLSPNPGRLEDPCALSGCRVRAGFSVGPCCCERVRGGLPTSLSGPSQSSHPPSPLPPQAHRPSQMPLSMVSVAFHQKWKILNRFIQKLQRRQARLEVLGEFHGRWKREERVCTWSKAGASNKRV